MEDESDDDSFEVFLRFKHAKQHLSIPASSRVNVSSHGETVPVRETDVTPAAEAVEVVVNALDAKANYELLYALDAWLEPLKEHTAPTCFVQLSANDVSVLLSKNSDTSEIEKRIDDELKNFEGGAAFCKLHTRSPKDAVVRLDGPMLPLVQQRMQKTPLVATQRRKRLIANDDANLISSVARELFRVTSGAEALRMCRDSARVRSDLEKARQARRGSVIVLRRFTLCLPDLEFRAFVHSRKLTGVSQYCYRQYFPEMLKRRTQIEAAITTFFEATMPLYPMDNFVCDVFLTWQNDGTAKVEIIELNPWFADTGALLFSWKSEEDRRILGGGGAAGGKTEFRYLTDVVADPYESLPLDWRSWFEKERKFNLSN